MPSINVCRVKLVKLVWWRLGYENMKGYYWWAHFFFTEPGESAAVGDLKLNYYSIHLEPIVLSG